MTTPVPQAVFVPPLLPTCVNGHLEVSDATPEDAQAFRPDETHYWVDTVLASIVPGLVLGIICAICMLALIVWTIVAHCRCWCATKRRHRKGGSKHHDMEDPFAEDERIMASPQITFSDRLPTDTDGRELRTPSRQSSGSLVSSFATQRSSRRTNSTAMGMTNTIRSSFGHRHDEVNAHFGLPKDLSCTERFHVKKLLCWSIILMTAATVGASAWGIYASVKHTDNLVPGFWDVYGQVQDTANNVYGLLSRLVDTVESAEISLNVLVKNNAEIAALASGPLSAALINATGSVGTAGTLTSVVDQLEPVSEILESVRQPLQEAANVSNETFVQGLKGFRDDIEPSTYVFQNTGRFIAIGVAFGLVILFAILAAALTIWTRWPRLGATSCILLWFMDALLMLLGVGLLNSIKYITEDGCLYAESFVVNLATERVPGDATQYALRAIDYYVDQSASTEYIPGQALTQIVSPVAAQLLTISEDPEVQAFLNQIPIILQALGTPTNSTTVLAPFVPSVSVSISPETTSALQNLGSQIPDLRDLLSDIDETASRHNVLNLYTSAKAYLCCTLSGDLSDLYVAWVITGVLALVLAILVTWRLVWLTREWYPKQ